MARDFEIKWGKISPAKEAFYLDVITFFLDEPALKFRCIIAEKAGLSHAEFAQNHDTWYYKMYFLLLRRLLSDRANQYRVYLDVKDTNSADKVRQLHNVLCHNMRDFDRKVLERVQALPSHEIQQIQLADILAGAVSFAVRGDEGSSAKKGVTALLSARVKNHSLTTSSWYSEQKFNIFRWEPKTR